MTELEELQHTKQYGKIFKSHFGPQFVVSIADRNMVAQVLRAESRAPQRANMESLSHKEKRPLHTYPVKSTKNLKAETEIAGESQQVTI
eukprot:g34527.t1